MTMLLYRWGLRPVLNEKSAKCKRLVFVNGTLYLFIYFSTQLISSAMTLGNSGNLLGVVTNEEFLDDPIAEMLILVKAKKKILLFYLRID